MTAAPKAAAQSDPFSQMLRGSVIPTVVAGVPCLVVAFVNGTSTGLSALIGAALVILFFGVTLLAMKRTASMPTATVMVAMMTTYTLKVLALGVAMVLLSRATWVNGAAVGLTVIVCAVVWIFFEMRAYSRLRVLAFGTQAEEAVGTEPANGQDSRP